MRITVVLAVTIGSLVLASTATALVLEWMLARRMTVDYLNDRAILTMDAIERGIRVHLDPAGAAIDGLATLLVDGRIDAGDPRDLEGALTAALAARSELSGIVFIAPDLEQTVAARDQAGALAITRSRVEAPDALARLAEMRQRRQTYWGDVLYVPSLKQSVINVRRAVYRGDTLIGYLAAGVTVGELSSLVDQLGENANETPFILYGDDRVLAHPRLTGAQPDAGRRGPSRIRRRRSPIRCWPSSPPASRSSCSGAQTSAACRSAASTAVPRARASS